MYNTFLLVCVLGQKILWIDPPHHLHFFPRARDGRGNNNDGVDTLQNPFETKQAPSLRTLYDLSDLEQSLFIYQTGQSGWVQNKLYRNMSALWAQNEYLPLKMKPQKVGRQLDLLIKEK